MLSQVDYTTGRDVSFAALGERFAMTWSNGGVPNKIVDLRVQEVYELNVERREYRQRSFAQERDRVADEHATAAAAVPDLAVYLPTTGVALPKQSRSRAKKFQYTVTHRSTGQHLEVAGWQTSEVLLEVNAVEQGKDLAKDGGWFVSVSLWISEAIPAVEKLADARQRHLKAITRGIYDTAFTETDFPLQTFFDPFYPELAAVGLRVFEESRKLGGTILRIDSRYEIERSEKEFREAQAAFETQNRRAAAAGTMILGGPPPKRTQILKFDSGYIQIVSAAELGDVSVPPGYVVKK